MQSPTSRRFGFEGELIFSLFSTTVQEEPPSRLYGFRALAFRAFCAKDDELHRGNLSENHALRQRLGAVVHAGVELVADNAVLVGFREKDWAAALL